jgi:hypothetical protein
MEVLMVLPTLMLTDFQISLILPLQVSLTVTSTVSTTILMRISMV